MITEAEINIILNAAYQTLTDPVQSDLFADEYQINPEHIAFIASRLGVLGDEVVNKLFPRTFSDDREGFDYPIGKSTYNTLMDHSEQHNITDESDLY